MGIYKKQQQNKKGKSHETHTNPARNKRKYNFLIKFRSRKYLKVLSPLLCSLRTTVLDQTSSRADGECLFVESSQIYILSKNYI